MCAGGAPLDGYEHRQTGPWHVVLELMGAGTWGMAVWQIAAGHARTPLFVSLLALGAILLTVAAMFGYLDVWDAGDRLSVRFGPLPLMGTSVPYGNIESVERSGSSFIYGYGVHGLPGVFLALNIWGMGAVKIRLKRRSRFWRARTVILGTDEPERLVEFLRSRMAPAPQ